MNSLSSLLQRQAGLKRLEVPWEARTFLTRTIAGGHCRCLVDLRLKSKPVQHFVLKSDYLSGQKLSTLLDAICAKNALPVLTSLTLRGVYSTEGLSCLAERLSLPGVLPLLKTLKIDYELAHKFCNTEEMEIMASMIEARAKQTKEGVCALEQFGDVWFEVGCVQATHADAARAASHFK